MKKRIWLLRGSLADVAIALVIFVFVVAIAIGILSNINMTPLLKVKNMANELISEEYAITIAESDYLDKSVEYDGLLLEKTIESGDNYLKIMFLVTDKGSKLLASKTVIVPVNENKLDDK